MTEGGIGKLIEAGRRIFSKNQIQKSSPPPQPETFEPPKKEAELPTQIPIDFSHKAAGELLRFARTKTQKGISESEVLQLIKSDPIFKDIAREDLSPILSEYNQPFSEEAVDFLATKIPSTLSRAQRRSHGDWLHNQYEGKGTTKPVSFTEDKNTKDEPKNETPKTPENKIRRNIVIEDLNSSLEIESDDQLGQYLEEKVKSEIPTEDLLGIIEKLRTTDVAQLLERYPKRVTYGPFEGFNVVPRGKVGRVLFSISKDGQLHIRVAKHTRIYASASRSSRLK